MAIRILSRVSIGLSAAAAAFTLLPAQASAQSLPATAASLAWSKSEAILGAPSALEAVLAQQHSPRARAAVVVPASYSIPRLTNAVVRKPSPDEGVRSGRPDVFGTVARKVGHTPLDNRWHSVEHAPVTGSAAHFAQSVKGDAPLKKLEAVNWYVNRRVQFTDDYKRFGRADVWSTANETLRSGRGDCEDFAIAKMQLLEAAGVAERDLYVLLVHDTARVLDHAVLLVRDGRELLVLDSMDDQVRTAGAVKVYRPVAGFSGPARWRFSAADAPQPAAPPETDAPADLAGAAPAAAGTN